jgi:hypothetical protein
LVQVRFGCYPFREVESSARGDLSSRKRKRKRGKKMTAKEKTKAAFEEEIKCHGLRQYSSYSLLELHFSFVLTWDSSTIPLPPLLMP